MVFLQGGTITGIFLVADGVSSRMDKTGGIISGVLKLLGLYYVFDLQYPRMYAMMLGLLQMTVIEELYHGTTSKGYKVMLKELCKTMDTKQ